MRAGIEYTMCVWDKLTHACMHGALRLLVPDGQVETFSQEEQFPEAQSLYGFQVAVASIHEER